MKTIVIAGASGFVGQHLKRFFESNGWRVLTIGRSHADGVWSDQASLVHALNGADAVVNLAGKSVNCRFTKANVKELIRSRVETTQAIGEAIGLCKSPPPVWINASGASIYREHVSEPNTEDSPTDGEGTMAEVARQWERAFFESPTPGTRKAALRITLVLGRNGGVFPIFKTLVMLGQGGRQGSGEQMMSWIHVDDLCSAMLWIINQNSIGATVNAAAPSPMSNANFMSDFRKSTQVKVGLPAPELLIRIGTGIIGADSELVLRGMDVAPHALAKSGFTFQFPSLQSALADLLN